jgi:hypothetical protein
LPFLIEIQGISQIRELQKVYLVDLDWTLIHGIDRVIRRADNRMCIAMHAYYSGQAGGRGGHASPCKMTEVVDLTDTDTDTDSDTDSALSDSGPVLRWEGLTATSAVGALDEGDDGLDIGDDGDRPWLGAPTAADGAVWSRTASASSYASSTSSRWSPCSDPASGDELEHEMVARLAREDWDVVEGLVGSGKTLRDSALSRIIMPYHTPPNSRRGGRRGVNRRRGAES